MNCLRLRCCAMKGRMGKFHVRLVQRTRPEEWLPFFLTGSDRLWEASPVVGFPVHLTDTD